MSEMAGSNLVLLKSLERGRLALHGLYQVPQESTIILGKETSLPWDLGTLPYSHWRGSPQ